MKEAVHKKEFAMLIIIKIILEIFGNLS